MMESARTRLSLEGPRTIVVGAGLAGLVIARELAARGIAVAVVDRNPEVGGLARTFRYGGWSFDVGPHRILAEEPQAGRVIRDALGTEVVAAPRSAGIHAFGATHAAVRWGMLRALPPGAKARALWEVFHREPGGDDSYEAEVVGAFGRTIYEAMFRRTTERFLRTAVERIDADWARLGHGGIERGTHDGALHPRRGIGALAEALASDVVAGGGALLLDREVCALEAEGDRVVAVGAGEERLEADAVVWTAPLTRALELLRVPPPTALRFVSSVLYNVALHEPSTLRFPSVCFAGEERFVRVSDPTAFSPLAAPAGKGALCVECTCREGDAMWEDPARHLAPILVGLAETGAMRSVRSVEAVWPERVPDTFPVLERGYREEIRGAMSSLARYRNLVLAGRGGLFWCNRMDESIAHGLRVAERLAAAAARTAAGAGEGGAARAS